MRNKSHVKSIGDALKGLVLFCLERQDWYEGNYASILYPNAKMDDRGIGELLKSVGTKDCYLRESFKEGAKGIIDNVHCQFTTTCNGNGKASTCLRLIRVIREDDSKPVYFRVTQGATLDFTTLKKTIMELGKYGIKVPLALLDAGYCNPMRFR